MASVLVGIVATVLAVVALSRLMDQWIDNTAVATADNMAQRVQAAGDDLARSTRFAAQNPELDDAVEKGDDGRIAGLLARANSSLDADSLMIVDENEVVLASTGELGPLPGDKPLGPRSNVLAAMTHATMLNINGRQTITAVSPVLAQADPHSFSLAVSMLLDDGLLRKMAAGSNALLCLYDSEGTLVAASVDRSTPRELGDSIRHGVPALERAVQKAKASGASAGGAFRIGDGQYRAAVVPVIMEGDPDAARLYLATVLGNDVTTDTRITTTTLIMMWSVLAVFVLAVLGWTVARSVSRPLVELAQGAHRVAEGDFSAKVEIHGENELAQLADRFNSMTDSLRERSESLTKKVLELATLYEMSRALGATLDMDTLLESVLDSSLRIFDVDLGYVTLRDRDTGVLTVRAWRGRTAQPLQQAMRSSMAEWVVREGRPLIFNPATNGESGEHVDTLTGAHAALCVPLVSADGVIGAVTVGSADPEFRFSSDDVRLLSTMANHVTIAIGNIELFTSLQEAYLATVRSLAAAVDAKDSYTRGHSDSVAKFAMSIAERLNLSGEQRVALEMAAYLHDIGKIGIKEEILLKPGRLTDAEFAQMKHHPLIGANILRPVAFPWPIAPVVRHHHEHYDGNGYPAGLRGEEIPLLARILTVADAFEAMVADRPYRRGRTQEEAILELKRCRGTHFDPSVVDAFVAVLENDERSSAADAAIADVLPEEAQAVLVAVCDGMFAAFRKLGGPRLAANLEQDFARFLHDEKLPFAFAGGHLSIIAAEEMCGVELDDLRRVVDHLSALMERTAGKSLVDHFYVETLGGISVRLACIAQMLELRKAAA